MNTDTDNWAAFQAALQWQPDPVEIDLLHVQRKERGTDIISMLVAIYGSKELFINEYRCGPSSSISPCRPEKCTPEHVSLSLEELWLGRGAGPSELNVCILNVDSQRSCCSSLICSGSGVSRCRHTPSTQQSAWQPGGL